MQVIEGPRWRLNPSCLTRKQLCPVAWWSHLLQLWSRSPWSCKFWDEAELFQKPVPSPPRGRKVVHVTSFQFFTSFFSYSFPSFPSLSLFLLLGWQIRQLISLKAGTSLQRRGIRPLKPSSFLHDLCPWCKESSAYRKSLLFSLGREIWIVLQGVPKTLRKKNPNWRNQPCLTSDYYKVIFIKTVWYCAQRQKYKDQPDKSIQFMIPIFDKGCKNYTMEKR